MRLWSLLPRNSTTVSKKIDSFCAHLSITYSLPTSVPLFLLIIVHLKSQNTAPSTISSYISILSFFYKINDRPDPTHSFLVPKTLAGARNLSAKPDARLPVNLLILYRLLQAAPAAMSSFYEISRRSNGGAGLQSVPAGRRNGSQV